MKFLHLPVCCMRLIFFFDHFAQAPEYTVVFRVSKEPNSGFYDFYLMNCCSCVALSRLVMGSTRKLHATEGSSIRIHISDHFANGLHQRSKSCEISFGKICFLFRGFLQESFSLISQCATSLIRSKSISFRRRKSES